MGVIKLKGLKRLTKVEQDIVEYFVGAARNSQLEDLHSGITPSSMSGDFTDVKVVTPYGEIPWADLSRISDKELGPLKDSFREQMTWIMRLLKTNGLSIVIEKNSFVDKASKLK